MGATKTARSRNEAMAGRVGRLRREIRTAELDELPGLVYRSLELADPLDRREMLLEALRLADVSNSLAIMDEFARITRDTGRIHPDEWHTALYEIGRKSGGEILDAWKSKGKPASSSEIRLGLYGWATADPQAALAWLEDPKNADYPGRDGLFKNVLAGAALHDANLSTRMMAELPESMRVHCIRDFTMNLIQNEGIDRAVDWMIEVHQNSGGSEPDYVASVENEIFERVFRAAECTHGDKEMAAHLRRIQETVPVSPERLASLVGRMHDTTGLDVLENLAGTPVLPDLGEARAAVIQAVSAANRQSSDATRQWLEKHPSSPLRPQIEEMIGVME